MAAGESSRQILGFLKGIEGLSKFSCEELENLLYQSRFDLLPPPKEGGGGASAWNLPKFTDIPQQDQMHEQLLRGAVPGGFQGVAHALYPEAVPWPASDQELVEVVDGLTSAPASGGALAEASCSSSPAAASASPGGLASPGGGGSGSPRTPGTPDEPPSGDDGEAPPRSVAASQHGSERGEDLGALAMAEITLCGRKVCHSVRGKAVHEAKEDFLVSKKDDEKYVAAKDARVKLERGLLLEEFQEKKLRERIDNLQCLKVGEIDRLRSIEQREASRRARCEKLKRQLVSDVDRKLEEEKRQAEEEKARRVQADAEQRQFKEQVRKQKDALHKWHADQVTAQVNPFTVEHVRQKKDQLFEEHMEQLHAKRRSRMLTVKRLEADNKAQRTSVAEEQRPPLPPKPHDRPGPLPLDLAGGGGTGARARSTSARRDGDDWKVQAHVLSNMYGLEAQLLEANLSRGVHGPGRMAGYAPRVDPKAPPSKAPLSARQAGQEAGGRKAREQQGAATGPRQAKGAGR